MDFSQKNDFTLDSDKNEAIDTENIMKNLTPEQLELITQVVLRAIQSRFICSDITIFFI